MMICAQEVTRRFGRVTVVDKLSFDVQAGEIFGFLGPNGAGKTTTIKMLTTLLQISSGQLSIDGWDVARDPIEVRRRIGIVFQDPSLDLDLTAWENLDIHAALYRVPRRIRRDRIDVLLGIFGLHSRRNDIVRDFSGGMKRRLEIARGLLHTPKVLFLDEPTLGLDPQSRQQLWRHVLELNRMEGVTIFLTTHYMEEAERVASRIAVVDNGRIVGLGTCAELQLLTQSTSLEQAFLKLTHNGGGKDEVSAITPLWRRLTGSGR